MGQPIGLRQEDYGTHSLRRTKGLHLSGSLEGQYNDLVDKGGYKATMVASDTFAGDTMGPLVSATYSRYKLRTDNLGEYSPANDTEQGQQFDFNGNGAIDDAVGKVGRAAMRVR